MQVIRGGAEKLPRARDGLSRARRAEAQAGPAGRPIATVGAVNICAAVKGNGKDRTPRAVSKAAKKPSSISKPFS